MSKNTKPEAATAVAGKPTKPKYIFQQYQEGGEGQDTSDLTPLFAEGFDPSPWHFDLIRFDGGKKAEARYFQQVRKDTHGEWFRDDAFDPIHGTIGWGAEYLHPSYGGVPELTLWVRPKEADDAEQEQMARASARRLEDNEKIKEMKQKANGHVGMELLGGVQMGRGWGGN